MSVHAGSREITDGLILMLDASNPKSYPGTGNTWFDISGNNNHFTIEGNINWNIKTGFSNFNGNSLGTGNKISRAGFPTNLKTSQGGTGYTVMVLCNSTSSAGWRKMIGNLDAENYIDLYQGSGAPYAFYTESAGSLFYNSGIPTGFNTLVISDSVYRLCIETNLNSGGLVNPAGALSIGNEPGTGNNYPWIGNIITVLMYNRVLTTTEMAVNFNALRSRFGL